MVAALLRRRILPLSLGAIAAVIVGVISVGVPAGAATTSSVLTALKATLAKQTGVHVVVSSKPSAYIVIADFGRNYGVEKVSSGNAKITIEVTPTYGYLSGTSTGLTTILGMSSAQAKKVGKRWVSIKAGSSEYSALKSGNTISAIAEGLPVIKGTSVTRRITGSAHLYVLKWVTAATSSAPALSSTMTVSAGVAPLPVEEITTDSSGVGTTKFSKWGEQVGVNPPPVTSTITYSKVTG